MKITIRTRLLQINKKNLLLYKTISFEDGFFLSKLSGNKRILLLGTLTLLLFPLLGFVISYLVEGEVYTFAKSFDTKIGFFQEIVIGVAVGLFFGGLAWQLIASPYLSPVLIKYGGVIHSLKLKLPTILFVSFCAGIGEEIFFRGVIQDYFGIIITAIVFVAIHGYLNFTDWKIFIYGLYMTFAIVAIGFMDQYFGLTSAMMAHTVIDVVLFYLLSNSNKVSGRNMFTI